MITRRKLLTGAAVLPAASVPLVTRNPEEQELIQVWRMLPDHSRALMHQTTRRIAGLAYDPALETRISAKWGPNHEH